jgi:hypothetical protein
MTNSATSPEYVRPRAEVLADAVISAYVHEISDRHRGAAPPADESPEREATPWR